MPKSERHEASFYNKNELDELFKVFTNDRMELVVHIAAYYGLRRSEIIGLKWDSINFEQKTITIRRKVITVSDDDGKYKPICEDKLKTNATRRTLPLIPHIEKLLKEKKEQQTHFKKLLKDVYNKEYDGFVCTDDMGSLITPEYVTTHFKYVIDKNGLKHIRFHDLRHTCASLLIANHIPLKAVQDWLVMQISRQRQISILIWTLAPEWNRLKQLPMFSAMHNRDSTASVISQKMKTEEEKRTPQIPQIRRLYRRSW